MKLSNLPPELMEAVCGLPVSHVWQSDGRAMFVEIGLLTVSEKFRRDGSLMNPMGQVSVHLYCEWRIETPNEILCGSRSAPEVRARVLESLIGRRISSLTLRGPLPEIDIALDGDYHLTTYSADIGQPEWSISNRLKAPPQWFDVREGVVWVGDGGPYENVR
jgi:hypothetical protein